MQQEDSAEEQSVNIFSLSLREIFEAIQESGSENSIMVTLNKEDITVAMSTDNADWLIDAIEAYINKASQNDAQ